MLQTITQLRKTSSHKEKIELLRQHKADKLFLQVLYYTYSPFMRYHIRYIPPELRGLGSATITLDFFKLLSKLVRRDLSGLAAKKQVFQCIEQMHHSYADVAKGILTKNLDIGCNAGLINRAYEGELIETHKVMLAKRFTPDVPLTLPIYVSPKIDGVRAVFRKDGFFTRNGHRLTGLDHLIAPILFRSIRYPLDGELYSPRLRFDEASGIIRSNSKAKPLIQYAVFDVIHKTWTQEKRVEYLESAFPLLGRGFDVEHVPHILVPTIHQVNTAYRQYRKIGMEGLVLKDPYATYQLTRSSAWLKMKPLISKEYKILEAFEGEGKYTGQLGGFLVTDPEHRTFRVGSGFTDTERAHIWDRVADYIGRYITIEAMEVTKTGVLRHPIYKGIRWDI